MTKPASHSLGRCELHLPRAAFDLDVAFDLPARGVLGLFGPSGCGKTSILRCIAGLEPAARGEITIAGERWLGGDAPARPPHLRGVGYVFQDSRLFPHLSVAGNIDYGARRRRHASRGRSAALSRDDVIELLDLAPLLDRGPEGLSGGERQRVAIARALLCDPRLLILDEPLASLDADRKGEILPYLERLHDDVEIPIVYVSHDLEEIQHLCDRLILLEAGRIRFDGPLADALVSPETGLVDRDDAASMLVGQAVDYDETDGLSTIDLGAGLQFVVSQRLAAGRVVRVRILATDASLTLVPPSQTTILNVLPGRIESIAAETDHHVTLRVALADQPLLVRISRKSFRTHALAPGTAVHVQVKAVSVHDALARG